MVDNLKIAAIFYEIADLLDLKGDNPFKSRAYRRAAEKLEGLAEPAGELLQRGKLEHIEGIGEALAKKIAELVATGSLRYYEDLKSEVPAGLLELLDIPGVGPKTARAIYQVLGISGIDAVEAAARAGKIRDIPGMGVKTEQNILRGIEVLRRRSGRIPLGVIYPIAVRLEEAIRRLPSVEDARVAGSARRMRETAGDIDIVAASGDPERTVSDISRLSDVRDVLSSGSTRARVVVREGIEADIWVVRPSEFWTTLHHATGSKEHNVRLRRIAQDLGLKLNEYGVFTASGERLPVNGEDGIYEALGMQYVPPEMREDRGEIESALSFSLPDLIACVDIKGDLHMHTDWSDGVATIEEMVEAGRRRGYSYIAICDHSKSLGIARGLKDEDLLEQMDYIHRLNEKANGIRVLAGVEVDIRKDGTLDYPDEVLSRLDCVVASIHSGFRQDRETMTSRIISAIRNPNVDIVAHPTGRLLGRREPYDVDMDQVISEAARTGTVLEINSYPDRLDLSDVWARRAKEAGVKISINTDAHSPDQLSHIWFGVSVARRGWLTRDDVVNSWPAEKLLSYLAKPHAE